MVEPTLDWGTPLVRAWDATANGVHMQEFGRGRGNHSLGRLTRG